MVNNVFVKSTEHFNVVLLLILVDIFHIFKRTMQQFNIINNIYANLLLVISAQLCLPNII